MSNVVDFKSRQNQASHAKKEARADNLKERFENALPSDSRSPKEKLLGIFKRKKKASERKPEPSNKGEGW